MCKVRGGTPIEFREDLGVRGRGSNKEKDVGEKCAVKCNSFCVCTHSTRLSSMCIMQIHLCL